MRFADEPELHEYPSEYVIDWDNLAAPVNYKVWDTVISNFTDEQRRRWTRSAANARRMAIDLVEGIGKIGDIDDKRIYAITKTSDRDDRRRPLIWEEDYCLIYSYLPLVAEFEIHLVGRN